MPTPLASIQRITRLVPIPGADRIELATVLGFQTVVKKGEFSAGDLCVFHLPDTLVDGANPAYSFLEKQGFRLKIAKLKGAYSQGLALNLNVLDNVEMGPYDWQPGDDVAHIVKISKYEKPMPEGSEGIGGLPSFVIKTDEPNILSAPALIDAFRGKFVYLSKKMDGQSATFYLNDSKFGVCSRNQELRNTPTSPFWKIARDFKIEQIMRAWGGNFNLQGELYGPGIQGNRMGATEKRIALFNFFDSDNHRYRNIGRLNDFCAEFDLPMVQIIRSEECFFSLDDLQEIADGLTYENGSPAEGLVIRPVSEVVLDSGERLSAKVISRTFLSKYGE